MTTLHIILIELDDLFLPVVQLTGLYHLVPTLLHGAVFHNHVVIQPVSLLNQVNLP